MSEAPTTQRPSYVFGPFRLDVCERRLWRSGQAVPIRSKIFDTLLALVDNNGRLLEKAELMKLVWAHATVEEGNLAHNISVLRKILGTDPADDPYIVTVPGKGYRFVAPVEAALEASIAVLPFVNMSSDPEQDFFCDGTSEEIINALTQVEGLRVVARTSSFEFRGRNVDVREVGRRLGVSAILEGSVRKSGNRLRIAAQLVRTSDGSHLWSGRYDRALTDVFVIQEEIAQVIVSHVRTTIGSPPLPIVKRPTDDQEVYHLFLEARHHASDESTEGTLRAIGLLERAIEREPGFAAGYALLAQCYNTLSIYGLAPVEEALPQAESSVRRALELDDSLAAAHRVLGLIRSHHHWDWPATRRALERALVLHPGAPGPHRSYALNFLAPLGRLREAEREMRMALDLNPLDPLENRLLSQILFWSRQYDAAVLQLRHKLELDPDCRLSRTLLAAVYTSMGRPANAVRERLIDFRRSGKHEVAQELRRVYGAEGEEGALGWYIEGSLARVRAGRGHPFNLALLYSQLGDRGSAFRWLEEAVTRKGGLTLYAKVHPWLDNVRSDPRFDALLDRIGVNDPALASAGGGR